MLLLDDLRNLYRSRIGKKTIPLRRPVLSYADCTQLKAKSIDGPEGQRLWDYWKNQLQGKLPVLNLPMDRPRPPFQTFNGASLPLDLGEKLSTQLKALSREQGVTLFTTLIAAFSVLMHRYSGQEDIILGTPTYGREQPEFETVVGNFINMVALRMAISGEQGFITFLESVRRTVLKVMEHQDYPFPLLVERLHTFANPAYPPSFKYSSFSKSWTDPIRCKSS